MDSPPTVLVFTYSECGQANVNLAISYELALAGVKVYIASFAALGDRVSRLQGLIIRHAPRSSGQPTGSVIFRELERKNFPSNLQAAEKQGITAASLPHPCGIFGALGSYAKVSAVCCSWSREEYLAGIESTKEIISAVNPDMVFMVLQPNCMKDIAVAAQPNLAALWKYPVLSSGFPFPLKLWQIPFNIYLAIRLAIGLSTPPNVQQIEAERKRLGLVGLMFSNPPGLTICPALAETDWPYTVMPEKVHLCGPIIVPFDPLEDIDPSMAKWLDNGPTIMINLGSHVVSNEKLATETASAIRILLDHHEHKQPIDIQVLWKVKANGDIGEVLDKIIGKEIKEERVKVLGWLEAEPVSILQHPNIICTAHHGGANSFYEGIWSGVPHIVLPVWFDTYDYANLVEFLNIGIFGSKSCAPGVRAEEFAKALVKMTTGEEAVKFRTAAKRLKDLCRAKGNGRELAASTILKEAGMGK